MCVCTCVRTRVVCVYVIFFTFFLQKECYTIRRSMHENQFFIFFVGLGPTSMSVKRNEEHLVAKYISNCNLLLFVSLASLAKTHTQPHSTIGILPHYPCHLLCSLLAHTHMRASKHAQILPQLAFYYYPCHLLAHTQAQLVLKHFSFASKHFFGSLFFFFLFQLRLFEYFLIQRFGT